MQKLTTPVTIIRYIHVWLFLGGILLFLLLLCLVSYVNTGSFFTTFSISALLREGLLILVQNLSVMYFVYYAILTFDKIYLNRNFTISRYVYELLIIVSGSLLINKFFHFLFIKLVVIPEADAEALDQKLRNLLVITQTMVVVMYGLITGFRLFYNLQQKQLELLRMQKEFAQTQFEIFKNQLNPHFLFNSLSALSSLVYADADMAEKFIEKLSRTYRYLLDQREKEFVGLAQELEFLENFYFLVEQRYGNKVRIIKELHQQEDGLYLLPHTMLIIMEYLIGSNTMSSAKPLLININIHNTALQIRHSYQPKSLPNLHLQEQLNSLLNNYQQMNKKITISRDENSLQQLISIPFLQKND